MIRDDEEPQGPEVEPVQPIQVTLLQAVRLTNDRIGQAGEVVLLSPALASTLISSQLAVPGEITGDALATLLKSHAWPRGTKG